MISKFTYKKLTWIDLGTPTKEEVVHITEEFNVPELVADELREPNIKSRVEMYENCIYLVLHLPHVDKHQADTDLEIDFVIGKDFLITTHYEKIPALVEFAKLFETNSVLDKGHVGSHAGYLFHHLMEIIYIHAAEQLEDINTEIVRIENKIFAHEEERMVEAISNVSRKLLDYKQAIRFHSNLLASFEANAPKFFGESYTYYARSITAEYNKLHSTFDTYKEILNDLRVTNDSLLTTKTNRTMKNLMMMSFVVFPLSLIAGIFGMNAKFIPLVGKEHDFWLIVGVMAIATFLMLIFFRIRKWL